MVDVARIGPVFGAELSAIDLSVELSADDLGVVRRALVEHEVLVFRNQHALTAEGQAAFGRRFGELLVSPFSPNADNAPELMVLENHRQNPTPLTDIWHTDETYREAPPMATILRSRIVPELGGDTMFVSMAAAYEGLTDRMQAYIAGLTAIHGFGRFDRLFSTPEARQRLHEIETIYPHPNHPVVRIHPESGKPVLFVNRHFTTHINELPDDEGRSLLEFLLGRVHVPEHQMRIAWEPDTVLMWDNRSVQHYAPSDYFPQRRSMERVTVAGDRPIPDQDPPGTLRKRVEVHGVPDQPDGSAPPPPVAKRQFERT